MAPVYLKNNHTSSKVLLSKTVMVNDLEIKGPYCNPKPTYVLQSINTALHVNAEVLV